MSEEYDYLFNRIFFTLEVDTSSNFVRDKQNYMFSHSPFSKKSSQHSLLYDCNAVVERSKKMPTRVLSGDLYPNPTSNLINLTWNGSVSAQIVLTDLQGKKLMTSTLSTGANSIDLSRLDSGLYIYQIFVDNRLQQNGKIVVTK